MELHKSRMNIIYQNYKQKENNSFDKLDIGINVKHNAQQE